MPAKLTDTPLALTTTEFAFDEHTFAVSVANSSEPLFVLNQVCDYLGYKSVNRAADKLKEREVSYALIPTSNGVQRMRVITEPGLYRLIFASKLAKAEAFKDFIFYDVIPSIRKTGQYQTKTYRIEFVKGQVTEIVNELRASLMTADDVARLEVQRGLLARFDKVVGAPDDLCQRHDTDFTIAREFALGKGLK